MSTSEAELEYDFGEDDLQVFVDHHVRNAPMMRRSFKRSRWVAGISFFVIAAAFVPISTAFAVAYAVLGIAWLALWPSYARWRWKRTNLKHYRSSKNLAAFGRTRLKLADRVITTSNSFATSEIKVEAIERVEQNDSHLFLYLGPFSAIIVPRNKVAAEKYDEVVNALAQWGLSRALT